MFSKPMVRSSAIQDAIIPFQVSYMSGDMRTASRMACWSRNHAGTSERSVTSGSAGVLLGDVVGALRVVTLVVAGAGAGVGPEIDANAVSFAGAGA